MKGFKYCKYKKFKFFGYCTKYKRGCMVRGCSYMKDRLKRKSSDKKKRNKATILNEFGNERR